MSSNKNISKGIPIPPGRGVDPGKALNDQKPKKIPPHRQVIEDAAKFNQMEHSTPQPQNAGSSTLGDDYEAGKVPSKRKTGKFDEDIKMVQDLDRWG
jgi:hypothetical protein